MANLLETRFNEYTNLVYLLLVISEPEIFQAAGIQGGLIVPESEVDSFKQACAPLRTKPEYYGFQLLKVDTKVYLVSEGNYIYKGGKRVYALNAIKSNTVVALVERFPKATINPIDQAWKLLSAEEYWQEISPDK